ncbi:DUF6682 family protein [Ferrimonas balearica]|uniref:phage adaptor protein n=1 Tax=Ferrimonas balearica TaxID=44012 RepID=UPI001F1FC44F|nr:DUF6682 family protein [Ferrimonas balearica]MBY6093857.1 hypothetical protein [Ferrimonas balearica]
MPATKVVDLINRAKIILQDPDGTRWPEDELLGWLNDAQMAIVNRRPDALVVNTQFQCAEGTKQSLATVSNDAFRLIKVYRNTTVGTVVRSIHGGILDDQMQDWHFQDPTENVRHYVFDPKDPKHFYVYPPAKAGVMLDLAYTRSPAVITIALADLQTGVATDTIELDDCWCNALLDFMLYRAFGKDSDYAPNQQRAMAHYQAFATAIGDKSQPDAGMSPMPLPNVGA